MPDYRLRQYRRYENGEPTAVYALFTKREAEMINRLLKEAGADRVWLPDLDSGDWNDDPSLAHV